MKNLKRMLLRATAIREKQKKEIVELKGKIETTSEECLKKQLDCLPPLLKLAVVTAFRKIKARAPRGMRYNAEWLLNCLLVRIASPRAYMLLMSRLMSRHKLTQILKGIPCKYGFQEQTLQNGSAVESSGSAAAACFGMPRAERVPFDIRGSEAEVCSEPNNEDSDSSSESDSEESIRDAPQRSTSPDFNNELASEEPKASIAVLDDELHEGHNLGAEDTRSNISNESNAEGRAADDPDREQGFPPRISNSATLPETTTIFAQVPEPLVSGAPFASVPEDVMAHTTVLTDPPEPLPEHSLTKCAPHHFTLSEKVLRDKRENVTLWIIPEPIEIPSSFPKKPALEPQTRHP
ncbi:hypothetical protein HPB52_003418 [Rhipicephalus sanguineus]|uniref:Uncharacterized protein n=1 Tax=Rhipicephalus sanguineus TaxID=34632 RepID=A0A9D4PTT2_RHISA|nr:hypothetical protein HPB52_003418 [Rhipicephalus sanguineus]